jgi:hypothetical protein
MDYCRACIHLSTSLGLMAKEAECLPYPPSNMRGPCPLLAPSRGHHHYRKVGSLQLLLSLKVVVTRSLPHILLPARFGFSLK